MCVNFKIIKKKKRQSRVTGCVSMHLGSNDRFVNLFFSTCFVFYCFLLFNSAYNFLLKSIKIHITLQNAENRTSFRFWRRNVGFN